MVARFCVMVVPLSARPVQGMVFDGCYKVHG